MSKNKTDWNPGLQYDREILDLVRILENMLQTYDSVGRVSQDYIEIIREKLVNIKKLKN